MAAARRALTFVNSRPLYMELQPFVPRLEQTKTTTLTKSDFHERDNTCQQRPIRLLYTGRLDRAKGLFLMAEALALLVALGEDVVLDLVGWPEKGDEVLPQIMADARRRGVEGRIRYHGFQPLGPQLFSFYRDADVYVLATINSEGFPRGIWEAMAHSLPVVATSVGSIPYDLRDGHTAQLAPPRNAHALSVRILQVIQSRELRKKLIREGFQLARENTLDRRASELASGIRSWISEPKPSLSSASSKRSSWHGAPLSARKSSLADCAK